MTSSCPFFDLTGFYCPGCGGTRAFFALLRGEFVRSFLLHPLVMYAVLLAAAFFLSFLLRLVSGGRLRCLKFRAAYVWAAFGIVAVNFIVKNILLLCGLPVLEII